MISTDGNCVGYKVINTFVISSSRFKFFHNILNSAQTANPIQSDLPPVRRRRRAEGSTIIPLCIVPHYKDVLNIQPHHAPVLREEFHKYEPTQWDLTTLRVNDPPRTLFVQRIDPGARANNAFVFAHFRYYHLSTASIISRKLLVSLMCAPVRSILTGPTAIDQ